LVFLLELVVRGGRVARHADHGGAGLAVIGKRVAKAAGLGGAAGGVVLRIEIQHHRFAAQLRQADAAVAVGRQGEVGGFVAGFDAHRAWSPVGVSIVAAVRRAGRMINRSYRKRTRAQAAESSASRRAKSIAAAPPAPQRSPRRSADTAPLRRRSAAPGSAPYAPSSRPTRAGSGQTPRRWTRSARIRRTDAAAYRHRRAGPARSAP